MTRSAVLWAGALRWKRLSNDFHEVITFHISCKLVIKVRNLNLNRPLKRSETQRVCVLKIWRKFVQTNPVFHLFSSLCQLLLFDYVSEPLQRMLNWVLLSSRKLIHSIVVNHLWILQFWTKFSFDFEVKEMQMMIVFGWFLLKLSNICIF